MRDGGDAQRRRRPHHGQGDVAALGKDDVRARLAQRLFGGAHARAEAEGQRQVGADAAADQFGGGDGVKGDARPFRQLFLDAVRADVGEAEMFAQFGRERQVGDDVSRAPAAGQDKRLHGKNLHTFSF